MVYIKILYTKVDEYMKLEPLVLQDGIHLYTKVDEDMKLEPLVMHAGVHLYQKKNKWRMKIITFA